MTYIFYLFISLTITAIDQYTKKLVTLFINEGQEINIINNFFNLTNTKNYGAAFSILQNQRLILVLLPMIFAIICIVLIFKNKNKSKLLSISLSFILGGAIGNLIDRALRGYVIDFLDFYFGNYHYPSFNVADSFVTVGTILLIIYLLFFEKKNEKNKANN